MATSRKQRPKSVPGRNAPWQIDPLERVWFKIAPNDSGCWIWQGSAFPDGYGQFKVKGRNWRVHRWLYTVLKGDIADGLVVMHSCDTPLCVNIQHLSLGTHQENQADSVVKGRRSSWRRKEMESTGLCWKRLHRMDEENTYYGKGYRTCKECVRIGQRRRAAKNATAI
jgi:hypothetical protein